MNKLLTVNVNTKRKADRIIYELKRQGRLAWCEEFCADWFYYVIFYKGV